MRNLYSWDKNYICCVLDQLVATIVKQLALERFRNVRNRSHVIKVSIVLKMPTAGKTKPFSAAILF